MLRRRGALAVLLLITTLGPAARPASAGIHDATLAVWPRTGLVHDQEVRIVIDGWEPRGFPDVVQCVAGLARVDPFGSGECEYLDIPRVGPEGRVRIRAKVDVILDAAAGAIDCRVEACEVVLADLSRPVARIPLSFDPAGPDPVHHPLSVTPADDLVDQQQVTVTGRGFEVSPSERAAASEGDHGPPRQAHVLQCVLPFDALDDCGDEGRTVQLTPRGRLSTTYRVDTRLSLDGGGAHDCRTGGCILAAFSRAGDWDPSEIARVPLTFDPDAPAPDGPEVRLEPGEDLRDGDLVDVVGTGFAPNRTFTVLQCRADTSDPYDCQGQSDGKDLDPDGQVDAQGRLQLRIAIHARIEPLYRPAFDCRVVACAVIVTTSYHGIDGAPRAPMALDPEAPLLDGRVEIVTSPPLSDGQRIRVRMRDLYPTTGVGLRQCVGRTASIVDLSNCSGRATTVRTPDRTPKTDFGGTVDIRRRIRTRDLGEVDCRVRRCHLVALAFDTYEDYPSERLDFSPP